VALFCAYIDGIKLKVMNENVNEVIAVLADYHKYFSTRTDMSDGALGDVMGALMEELLEIASKAKA
jgi:hypothetical protein